MHGLRGLLRGMAILLLSTSLSTPYVKAQGARADSISPLRYAPRMNCPTWDLEAFARALTTPLLPLPDVQKDIVAPTTVRLFAAGDIMLGSDFPTPKFPLRDDALWLLRDVAPIVRGGDLVFGNLEGAFLQGGQPFKQCKDPKACYLFRMPPRYAGALKEAGFNIMSLANNHVGDFGTPAQRCTMRLLDSLGIAHAGLEVSPVDSVILESGIRVGICAFAPNRGTCRLNDAQAMVRIVRDLASRFDLVVASCHMGAEGAKARHITRQDELFHGENRGNPYRIARLLIDAGADVVIGHGPHVPRALDLYKGRLIAYSLGNFCTYGGINVQGVNGLAPLIEAVLTPDGSFVEGRVHPFTQHRRQGPEFDAGRRTVEEIRSLMAQDVPESPLELLPDGTLRVKQGREGR